LSTIWRTALLTAIIALAAGALGVYAGLVFFGGASHHEHSSLDEIVHREIHLSADQGRHISRIEANYAQRRLELETEMRSATREIAAAVAEDKSYSDRVERGVADFHEAMGKLQEETILHVFEMRAVLDAAQQAKFDEIVHAELLRSIDEAEFD
jgi:hypothetical protein